MLLSLLWLFYFGHSSPVDYQSTRLDRAPLDVSLRSDASSHLWHVVSTVSSVSLTSFSHLMDPNLFAQPLTDPDQTQSLSSLLPGCSPQGKTKQISSHQSIATDLIFWNHQCFVSGFGFARDEYISSVKYMEEIILRGTFTRIYAWPPPLLVCLHCMTGNQPQCGPMLSIL